MINFEKIEIQNFISVGNQPLTIDFKKGLHYVTGRDVSTGSRNGVGKTAIFVDAILFALYGKTARRTKIWRLINSKNGKKCQVKLWFNVDGKSYLIERGIYPDYLTFTQPDGTKLELSAKKETQEVIAEIIKIDFTACRNMLVMSINSSKHFMSMSKYEKRMFIEQILSIDVIGWMYKIISWRYNDLRGDLRNLEGKYSTLKKHYEDTVKQNEKLSREIEQFQIDKEDQIQRLTEELAEAEAERMEIGSSGVADTDGKLTAKITEFKHREVQLREKITQLKADIKYKEKSIKSTSNKIELLQNSTCWECESEITEEHRDSKLPLLQEKVINLSDEVNEKKAKIHDFTTLLTAVGGKIHRLENQVQEAARVRAEIESLTQQIALKRQYLDDVKNSKVNISKIDVSRMKTDYDKVRKNLVTTTEDFKYAKLLRSIFSDEGIKSYIVRQVLPLLNSKLNEYLKLLGSAYYLEFDDRFNEVIKSAAGRKLLPYDSFSAGEQKRVDLALLLTFIDIARMQGRSTTNLLILDEVTDSSLDSDGLESFIDIISDKVKQEDLAIYVISHRKDYASDTYDSIIVLEKDQGFTRIKHIY